MRRSQRPLPESRFLREGDLVVGRAGDLAGEAAAFSAGVTGTARVPGRRWAAASTTWGTVEGVAPESRST